MKAFVLLLATLSASAQLPPDLDAYIEKARVGMDVPGIAITIVRDGKVLATKGYGVRELGKPERIDADTMFDTASLSKSFTAAAIATLVDEGKMTWDDPVVRHLPRFELSDPYRTGAVTIRDLLAHRVGVEQGNWVFRITSYDTAEVLRRARFLEVREPFRGGFIYWNIGYSAAAEAAAHAAGMPFSELLQTRLLEPLGMRDSTAGIPHILAANHASPHARVERVHRPIRNKKAMAILGANAVNSTARDMAKWLLFQLGDGTWEGKRIISAAAMREMHAPQIVIPTTPEMRAARGVRFFAGYGLGWQVMDFRGHPMLWHSGSNDGMPVYMAILPAEKIGVCVMTNSWESGVLHGALAARILDTLLEVKEPRDWAGELIAQRNTTPPALPARVEGTGPSLPLESYAGTYEDRAHGTMVVTHANGRLTLQFGGGELADLTHWHYDTFRVVWRDRTYEFADTLAAFGLDAGGQPRRFEMRLHRDTIAAVRP